jgi:hypothetical protein
MVLLLNLDNLPSIHKIESFNSTGPSKLIPYTMIAGCVVLAGYALWPSPQKVDLEEEEEADEN